MVVSRVIQPADGHKLRPATEDGWVQLTRSNLSLGHRYIEVMCHMNRPSYATSHPARIVERMSRFPCEYFYYPGVDFEVVCGFKWSYRLRHYRLMSVGFVGDVSPREALELVVERFRRFVLEKQVDHVIAVRPLTMENPAILEFYELVLQHPSLVVRGTHVVKGGTYWWLRLSG